jgi:hypothetical protein
VPVGIFIEVINEAGGWQAVREVLADPHGRRGPSTWRVDTQSQQLVEFRFGQPEGAEDAGGELPALAPADQPRQHRLVHHLLHLARHARQADHGALARGPVDQADEAGRGARRIRHDRGTLRKQRLLPVVGGHLAASRAEPVFDRSQGSRIEL